MTNPFFRAGNFPFWRGEAATFVDKISSTFFKVDEIKHFYERCGGDLSRLATDGKEPYYIWRDVLQRLAAMNKIEQLCDLLLASPEAPALREATEAIRNAGNVASVDGGHPTLLEPSVRPIANSFFRNVTGWAKDTGSLAMFVSPYAAYDVDRVGDPRQLARAVLQRSLLDLQGQEEPATEANLESDVLSNLLVATSTSFAMSSSYKGLWNRICDIAAGQGGCSRLYRELAAFAVRWQEASEAGAARSDSLGRPSLTRWKGLLLVTFEMNSSLERELADAGVDFGVLNVLAQGEFSYLRHVGRNTDQTLRFETEWSYPSASPAGGRGRGANQSQTGTASFIPSHPVVVVKLMGIAQLRDLRPLLGLEIVAQFRDGESLPATIAAHLQKSPFVMLGGGLLDPFVALAFEAHFRPQFRLADQGGKSEEAKTPRWVVLHPSPPDDDMLRVTECVINRLDIDWTDRTYGLDLLVADLPETIGKIGDRIAMDANLSRSAA